MPALPKQTAFHSLYSMWPFVLLPKLFDVPQALSVVWYGNMQSCPVVHIIGEVPKACLSDDYILPTIELSFHVNLYIRFENSIR